MPIAPPIADSPSTHQSEQTDLVISDSGNWALLDSRFYETESVHQNADGNWLIQIRSNGAEEDAHLGGLMPHKYGRTRPIAFAHRNNGFLAAVRAVESVSRGGEQVWTVSLAPEDIEYGGSIMDVTWQTGDTRYTPDDFARLRAGRILLNNPPPIKDDNRPVSHDQMGELMLESHIRGTNNPVSVEHCIIQVIYQRIGNDAAKFLRLARLTSLYFLRAGGAVERILELTLGPIANGKVHVRFRGRRGKAGLNAEPAVIELEGDCPLS